MSNKENVLRFEPDRLGMNLSLYEVLDGDGVWKLGLGLGLGFGELGLGYGFRLELGFGFRLK